MNGSERQRPATMTCNSKASGSRQDPDNNDRGRRGNGEDVTSGTEEKERSNDRVEEVYNRCG